MTKRSYKIMTKEEKWEWSRLVDKIETEKPEIIQTWRRLKKEHEAQVTAILKEIRETKEREGLSLTDLSQRTGIDRTSLSRLFNSTTANPTLSTLNRIAAALGKSLVVHLK